MPIAGEPVAARVNCAVRRTARPPPRITVSMPMSGKLFIKTHGCQMNEYDSAKMADVLGAAHGLVLT